MTGLDIPIEFMNIEELARRWKCTLSTIESLAETDKLKFCLRPAALEVALARIPLERYSIMVRRLASMYIDHRYVYLMFKDREHKIEIARIGNYDVKEIPPTPVSNTSTQTNVSVNAPITINASAGATAEQIAQQVSMELNAREQAAQRRQRGVNYD